MARATSIFYTAKSVRRQPTFSPLDKSRRTFLGVFLTLTVLTSACAVFYIGTHIQAVNLGYKISQELQKKERLIEENKRLDLEIARLKSPIRIEKEAKAALGLVLPKTPQVFYLSRWDEELNALLAAAPENPRPAPDAQKAPAPTLAKKSEKTKPETAKKSAPANPEVKTAKAEVPAKASKPSSGKEKPVEAPAKVASAAAAPKSKAEVPTKAATVAAAPPAKTLARKPETPAKDTEPKNEPRNPEKQKATATETAAPATKKREVLMARIIEKASTVEKSPQPKVGPALAYQPKEKVPAVMLDPMP